ncbi:MAG: SsrA-binding protein [Chlamydiae bacterium RIFCSPHIGHO2_12_FULL_49_11]|nr:MAG: SsrA-binding protein [Chlamydiae bacterium RIFCSPHIGHO2_12_FULL_49_11]
MAKHFPNELASNRAAFHHFEILETFEAGIALLGTEVKSAKEGHASLQDNHVRISAGEAWLKNAFIAAYTHGNIHNHPERRDRKLLLHKSEILKLKKLSEIKGHTIVALSLYLKKGKIKVHLGVCHGKTLYDKRQSLKKKEHDKEIQLPL